MATTERTSDVQPLKILLQGPPGIGKSTAVGRLVDLLHAADVPVAGFLTREVCEDGRRVGFSICDLDGAEAVIAHEDYLTGVRVGRYAVEVQEFERVALPALARAFDQGQIVVIDEIARMQLASGEFVRVLQKVMEQPMPVVATVHVYEHPVTDALLCRGDVEVIEVTEDTRDELPARLLALLLTSGAVAGDADRSTLGTAR